MSMNMVTSYEYWYNPKGIAILNGGAAVRLFEETENEKVLHHGAEVLVIRQYANTLMAYFGNLYEDDFYEGGAYAGEAEKLVSASMEEIAESWEERELADFYVKAAEHFNQTRLKNLRPAVGDQFMLSRAEAKELLHKMDLLS